MRSVVKLQTLTIANKRWLVLYAVDRESAAAAHRKVLRTDVLPKTDKLTADKGKLSKAVNGEYVYHAVLLQCSECTYFSPHRTANAHVCARSIHGNTAAWCTLHAICRISLFVATLKCCIVHAVNMLWACKRQQQELARK